MSRIILVHGAWHGGWCWSQLLPRLQDAGHEVFAPDLPGHGDSTAALNKVSLNRYVSSIAALLDDEQPTVLIGHSMGGLVISQLAERYPEKIEKLIFVCAFLLKNGESVAAKNGSYPALLGENMRIAEDGLSVTITPEMIREIFYHDCDSAQAKAAEAKLVTQAAAPINTPAKLTEQGFGSVLRDGIVCLQDKALHPDLQRQMYRDGNCERVFEIDASHSPFISMPAQLAELIESSLN